ncbi:unnamed protein product [Staurois parvus]|uniref:Large ribosomal subunit protein P2 n=1 Tax=Staurois parvus TaxID=386267 RepID=A0ABN9GS23_9NEOB|nr:unnamed protein product [Staurois parvus]
MRYIAAYLLAVLGGNDNPSIADLKKILDSVGIELEKERAEKVIGELKGKKIDEVIAQGKPWKHLCFILCYQSWCSCPNLNRKESRVSV